MEGLEGVRVLELGQGVSAAYAAKLVADLGGDVVKAETPEGDSARARGPFPGGVPDREASGLFLYLNANKRGVTLDLSSPRGRARLEELLAWCEILIHNLQPSAATAAGLDAAALHARLPRLVTCAITPFGSTGRYADYRAEEITVQHGGGWGWLSPGALADRERPPLKAFGHQADFQAGLAGATATLAAYLRAARTGVGESIDLSAQAYVASLLEAAFPAYTYAGQVGTRHGQRGLNPWAIFECRDGRIFLCTIEQDQWERLVEFMGTPEWAELEVFRDFRGRLENVDMLTTFLQEWIGDWKVDDLFHAGQKQRICFAPVFSMSELGEQEHLRARGFFVDVRHPRTGVVRQPGPPYRLRAPWWRVRRPAPLLGEHDADRFERGAAREPESRASRARPGLPLEGVRVADFTWVWAGPFCAMQLAHLGAEVIKVESAGRPDLGRRLPIFAPDAKPSLNASGYFNQWNQGKKSLRLDLAKAGAVEVAKRLIAECDVVVDNFATGVMERLGLAYEALAALRPDIICASISGYGGSGPYREYMAYGPAIAPLSGLSSLSGYPGGPPSEVGISLGDPTAGITTAAAICAALVARERTGAGQHIDVSLWESTAALVAEGWMDHALNGSPPPRMGNRDPRMAPHGCYRCSGADAWVTIACATDAEWRALAGVIDPALAGDARFAIAEDRKRHEDALDRAVERWTSGRDRWDVTSALQAVGVAAFPSLTVEDLANDPELDARGFLTRLEHPEVGVRLHAGVPWSLGGVDAAVRRPAPLLGADTEEILRGLLGYSEEEVRRLTEAGALD